MRAHAEGSPEHSTRDKIHHVRRLLLWLLRPRASKKETSARQHSRASAFSPHARATERHLPSACQSPKQSAVRGRALQSIATHFKVDLRLKRALQIIDTEGKLLYATEGYEKAN